MNDMDSAFRAAVQSAKNRKKPFIAYSWKPDMFRSGQHDSGFLVVSLGEHEVPYTLTPAQERQKALGKKFPATKTVDIKPDKYEKDIEKLRKQGRLCRLAYGDDEGRVIKEEEYAW